MYNALRLLDASTTSARAGWQPTHGRLATLTSTHVCADCNCMLKALKTAHIACWSHPVTSLITWGHAAAGLSVVVAVTHTMVVPVLVMNVLMLTSMFISQE